MNYPTLKPEHLQAAMLYAAAVVAMDKASTNNRLCSHEVLRQQERGSPHRPVAAAEGHDVLYAAETDPGQEDAIWLHQAEQSERLIVTADKDFGELIFRDCLNSHGVVLMRMHRLSLRERFARLAQVWSIVEANSTGKFIVITEGRVRVRNLKLGGKGKDGSDRLA